MRKIPHLRELPEALAMFFTALDGMTPAQVRDLDLMAYLDDKITDRVRRSRVVPCEDNGLTPVKGS